MFVPGRGQAWLVYPDSRLVELYGQDGRRTATEFDVEVAALFTAYARRYFLTLAASVATGRSGGDAPTTTMVLDGTIVRFVSYDAGVRPPRGTDGRRARIGLSRSVDYLSDGTRSLWIYPKS